MIGTFYRKKKKKMRIVLSEVNLDMHGCSFEEKWHPQGDSNPCCRRERAVS
jgi:hypothetical protein